MTHQIDTLVVPVHATTNGGLVKTTTAAATPAIAVDENAVRGPSSHVRARVYRDLDRRRVKGAALTLAPTQTRSRSRQGGVARRVWNHDDTLFTPPPHTAPRPSL